MLSFPAGPPSFIYILLVTTTNTRANTTTVPCCGESHKTGKTKKLYFK